VTAFLLVVLCVQLAAILIVLVTILRLCKDSEPYLSEAEKDRIQRADLMPHTHAAIRDLRAEAESLNEQLAQYLSNRSKRR
jgi:hypothetical protein